jgi:hypothetical protein
MPADVSDGEARPRTRTRRKSTGGKEVPPASNIALHHPSKERVRRISTGFAWDVFLLSGITFGLPLFLRRLPQWGAAVLALWVGNLLIGRFAHEALWVAEAPLFGAFFGLQLWLGFRGNALTARAYLAHGWTVEDARDAGVKRVLQAWHIPR